MLLAVEFYNVVQWVHITAFVIAFGPTFAYGAFYAVAGKSGPESLITVANAIRLWDRTAVTIGGTLILLSGLYMAGDGPYGFSDFFVSWGIVAIFLILGLTHAFFLPQTGKVIEFLESGRGEEAMVKGQQIGKVGAALGVVVILTIYVMTAKPFL